jgi:hypothetical protein
MTILPSRAVVRASLTAVALAFLSPGATLGQDGESTVDGERPAVAGALERPRMEAGILEGSIRIDGRLDDAAWAAATPAAGFIQGEPVEGLAAEQDTEVRILIGESALYVAARMHDDDPGSIGRQLVRRDESGAYDWFSVALDPNLDLRTGYNFQVSAAGVQSDQYLYDDQRMDAAWDAVWEAAVEHDDGGWTVEMRIPLSQIRYESGEDPQSWGINFARRRLSSNELSYFSLKSRLREGTVSQFGTLEEVALTGSSRRIEVRPYVVSSLHRGPSQEGDPFFDGTDAKARVGGDVRVGLGSAFTLDATINPDFGQVEADPAVINLSAFETFFEERRPFFVEDAQVFDFTLSGMRNQLFYSRRLGREPRGGAPSGSEFIDEPGNATILGAAKLTGRTSSGLSIGVLAAVTDEEGGRAYLEQEGGEGAVRGFLAEPRSEFGVVKLQQDFNGGASQVGGIVTAMHRDLPADGGFDFLADQAYNGGVRFEHLWSDREWSVSGFLAGSHVLGEPEAVLRLQQASNHYYQRPDASRAHVDSAATSMTGLEWRMAVSRQNGEHWTGGIWLGEVTQGFEINDLGFSQSREKLDAGARIAYREIRPGSWYRNYNVNAFAFRNWSHEALDEAGSWESWTQALTSASVNVTGRATLKNYWGGDLNLTWRPRTYSHTATRGGPVMIDPGGWSVRGGLNTDRRKSVSLRGGFNINQGFQDSGDELRLNGTVSLRPTPQLEIEVQPSFSTQRVGDQYVASTATLPFEPTFGRRYVFGELERTTVSMETRVNWTFSPALSLQLFAQPLLSSGDYVSYKQLAAAGSYDFDEWDVGELGQAGGTPTCVGGRRCTSVNAEGAVTQHVDLNGDGAVDWSFSDQDFNVRSLVGNAVLRWEYRPGSTIFLVWQRQQAWRTATGDFDFGRDLDALLGAPADDRFILKVNYWLGM